MFYIPGFITQHFNCQLLSEMFLEGFYLKTLDSPNASAIIAIIMMVIIVVVE